MRAGCPHFSLLSVVAFLNIFNCDGGKEADGWLCAISGSRQIHAGLCTEPSVAGIRLVPAIMSLSIRISIDYAQVFEMPFLQL